MIPETVESRGLSGRAAAATKFANNWQFEAGQQRRQPTFQLQLRVGKGSEWIGFDEPMCIAAGESPGSLWLKHALTKVLGIILTCGE